MGFESTNSFSRLIVDYLSGEEHLKSFFSFSFDKSGFGEAIRYSQSKEKNRELLCSVIHEQYLQMEGISGIPERTRNGISLLKNQTTFTVTTGHQLNIFTGPLFFIYKIISTISLAKKLKEFFPEYDFVPLYWMASEDHDVDEINHINLFGKKIEWKESSGGAAGKLSCDGIPAIMEEIKVLLGNDSKAGRLMQIFSEAYKENRSLSQATRIIVHELFKEDGLLILDACDARLKKTFIREMKEDVLHHHAYRLVNDAIGELEKKYKAQVHPREINLFYLGDHFRERIVAAGSGYEVMNTGIRFTEKDLMDEIENHPEKFSPNVVLRPLYQETVLPNIAVVGGPAEVSYWLEFKKMFEHHGMSLPVLVLRSCIMILDASSKLKLDKLGILPEEIFLPEDALVKKFLSQQPGDTNWMQSTYARAEDLFNDMIPRVSEKDPTLKPAAEAEKQKVMNGLKALEEKVIRAEKKKHETSVSQVKKIKEKFFPENILQERYENILAMYSKYGDDFLSQLALHVDPLEKKFILLVEE